MKLLALQLGTRTRFVALGAPLCLVAATSGCLLAQNTAAFRAGSVSGTIVDADGVPQMGALVQLLLPDSRLVATAVTDANGHYRLPAVLPGAYRVRATAALFMPAFHRHLVVAGNTRAIVNMTLSTMLATGDWLPAARRTDAEADDDWIWTLRSSTMRPVLRLAGDDEDGSAHSPTSISSSAEQPRALTTAGRVSVQDNEGGFARGGTHNVLSMVRRSGDVVAVMRADLSGPRTPFPVAPSAELTIGTERRLPFSGTSRSILTYTSHPEVLGAFAAGSPEISGQQTAVLRNAQRMELGDSIRLDAGSVTRDVSLGGNTFTVEPFLQLAVHPASGVVISYTFTEARGTESLDDLDRVRTVAPAVFSHNGHALLDRGSHHSLGLAARLPHKGVVQVAVFRDRIDSAALAGIGLLPVADAITVSSAADPTTATFLAAARPYDATGLRLVLSQPVNNSLSIEAAFADGQALHALSAADVSLDTLVNGLSARNSVSASVAATGHFQRSGTTFRAGYRWQPQGTLTAVDRFRATDESAYLHAQLRQSLRSVSLLPAGFEAIVEVQNLLAEGYQPFLSRDGHTLFLAQSPRVLQAGLSFTF